MRVLLFAPPRLQRGANGFAYITLNDELMNYSQRHNNKKH